VVDGIERLGKEAVGERVVDHEVGDFEKLGIAGTLDAIALEGSQVVGVAEFGAELLEDLPVTLSSFGADFDLKMALEVGGDAVVVDERVVDVEEKNGASGSVGAVHD
jgi:hypothetical protein